MTLEQTCDFWGSHVENYKLDREVFECLEKHAQYYFELSTDKKNVCVLTLVNAYWLRGVGVMHLLIMHL